MLSWMALCLIITNMVKTKQQLLFMYSSIYFDILKKQLESTTKILGWPLVFTNNWRPTELCNKYKIVFSEEKICFELVTKCKNTKPLPFVLNDVVKVEINRLVALVIKQQLRLRYPNFKIIMKIREGGVKKLLNNSELVYSFYL